MRIFVSSTFEDLREHREAAIRGLRQLGHDVVAMEDFTAMSAPRFKWSCRESASVTPISDCSLGSMGLSPIRTPVFLKTMSCQKVW